MSDFIYSSVSVPQGKLSECIRSIYHKEAPAIYEYHGEWGSLAASQNIYTPFQPYETEFFIAVVIGGPVLCYQNNRFLTEAPSVKGTQSVLERFLAGQMQWSDDLSGPFVVLIIDKFKRKIMCTTDMMLFLPVYCFNQKGKVVLGTHIDAVAKAANREGDFDHISLADFILHDIVTFPYTAYTNTLQLLPATEHIFEKVEEKEFVYSSKTYWVPVEGNPYESIDQAGLAVRESLCKYVDQVTSGMSHVAHFISAGEDSRAVAGLLPQSLQRDAFIAIDGKNREWNIARKVAEAYDAKLHTAFRSPNFYLDILPEASDLIGCGHQYHHAHVLAFEDEFDLSRYSAIFGGFLSDRLLKGLYANTVRGKSRFPFLPDIPLPHTNICDNVYSILFNEGILEQITQRRREHFEKVRAIRPGSTHEWFTLWTGMAPGAPNVYVNRRKFRSYEPFMANGVVKISAAVPLRWKLNKRLFNKAVCPFLQQSKWIMHPKGYLPYYPWWCGMPSISFLWLARKIGSRMGFIKGNQGPWGDWKRLLDTQEWHSMKEVYLQDNLHKMRDVFKQEVDNFDLLKLKFMQEINLIQVLYCINKYK